MFISRCMSLVAHWLSHSSMKPRLFYSARPMKRTFLSQITSLLLALTITVLLTACFGSSGQLASATPTVTSAADVSLAQLHWCKKPFMLFRDEGAVPTPTPEATPATATPTVTSTPGATATVTSRGTPTATATTVATPGTPTTITDWSEIVANLGFTVYLPVALPRNSCLVSAQAVIHDPTFGGSFLIGYLLSDHTSITFSEAPLASQNTIFACYVSNSTSGALSQKNATLSADTSAIKLTPTATATPTQLPLQVCSGAKANTSVVLSARRSIEYLQQLFTTLKPNVTWIPAT